MEQTGFDDDRNDPRTQALIRQLERFIGTFRHRAGDYCAEFITREEKKLSGEKLTQEPERFIEEELITRVAKAMDWEVRFQPRGIDGLGDDTPDFRIMNLGIENLGEVKTPGYITNARKQAFNYAQATAKRPMFGIATDGFTWILFVARDEGKPIYTNHERIYGLLKKYRIEQDHEIAHRRDRTVLREEAQSFVDAFHREELRSMIDDE